MGQISVSIGGRRYPLACADGEEAHLAGLAAQLDGKAGEVAAALGQVSEPRLLLMAGLLLADDLHEARRADGTDRRLVLLEALTRRAEALADALTARAA